MRDRQKMKTGNNLLGARCSTYILSSNPHSLRQVSSLSDFTDSEKWGQGGVTCSAAHLVSEELKQSCLVPSSYGILLQKGRGTVAPEERTYQCGSCSTFVRRVRKHLNGPEEGLGAGRHLLLDALGNQVVLQLGWGEAGHFCSRELHSQCLMSGCLSSG